jgi:hypothetical protein
MTETGETRSAAMTSAEIISREKALRLKELEIADKEYEQKHRPSRLFSTTTNPAVIAPMIAAWATLSAGLITWFSGKLSADAQQTEARLKAEQDELNFETGTVVAALNNIDDEHIATRLNLLIEPV